MEAKRNLILTRRCGESIVLDGGRIVVTVIEFKGEGVRIGVRAPADVRVDRKEVFERIQEVQP